MYYNHAPPSADTSMPATLPHFGVVHPVMYMPLSTFFTMSATPQAAMLSATIPAPYAIWRQQDVSSPAQCCNCIQDKSVTAPPPFSDISPQYSIAMPGFFYEFLL